MGWLNVFATIAYAGWTAAVLATIGVILAEYRASRDPIWLLVLLTAGLQLVGSGVLTITIGSWQSLPWLPAAIVVRAAWLLSAGTLWATVICLLWRRYHQRHDDAL